MTKRDWWMAGGGVVVFAFALLCVAMGQAQQTPSQVQAQSNELTGQWVVERHAVSGNNDGKDLELTLRYQRGVEGSNYFHNSSNSFDIASSSPELKGLDAAALASTGSKSQFDLVRDAGTFHCEGWFAQGSASGRWTFAPNTQYAAALRQKGVGTPTAEQQMRLALSNSSLQLVDVLKQAGYTFDVDELIRTANHGVSLEYVRDMNQLGYKPETLEYLIKMRDHGVGPEYVRALAAAGLGKMPAPEVIKMRDHGVTPDYIHGLAQHGIKGLSGEELARLRDHGVDPAFIAGMQASGINGAPQEWISLRDHGVNPEFVTAIEKTGMKLSANDLIRLRDHGVSPEYIAEVREAGLKTATPEELLRLRDHGVGAAYIREYGSGHSVEELIYMHDRGVRAEM